MDTPLGNAVGNSLEVMEAVDCLRGRAPEDYTRLTYELASRMLYLAGFGSPEACPHAMRKGGGKRGGIPEIPGNGGGAGRKRRLDRRHHPVSARGVFPHRARPARRIYLPHRYGEIRNGGGSARRGQAEEGGRRRFFRGDTHSQKDGDAVAAGTASPCCSLPTRSFSRRRRSCFPPPSDIRTRPLPPGRSSWGR